MPLTLSSISSILGNGLAFPFQIDPTSNRPKTASGEDLVQMSIEQIINTDIHERPFLVKDGVPFGTRVRRSLFQPADVFVDVFLYDVPRALRVWEPRIIVQDVTAVVDDTNPHKIVCNVTFVYTSTSQPSNYVEPYMLRKTTP